jgi:hypothetical protein
MPQTDKTGISEFHRFTVHFDTLSFIHTDLTVSTQTSALFSSYYTQLTINILIKHYLILQYAAT